VHVVTVNDYLARRDAEWMGQVYRFLGLTVGVILPQHDAPTRSSAAYAADITYGTNNEFGFDYLRDNMEYAAPETACSASSHYAIVDEVDSILIDEARTPLIISGQAEDRTELYDRVMTSVARARCAEQGKEPSRRRLLRSTQEAAPGASSPRPATSRPSSCWREQGLLEGAQPVRRRPNIEPDAPPARRRCARTRSSSATSTTWCRTARSSSSTSSPAA
jgi:hypothetical protein